MMALPDARQHTVARFRNRQDALAHVRTLQRFMQKAKFEVVFDAPSQEPVDSHP